MGGSRRRRIDFRGWRAGWPSRPGGRPFVLWAGQILTLLVFAVMLVTLLAMFQDYRQWQAHWRDLLYAAGNERVMLLSVRLHDLEVDAGDLASAPELAEVSDRGKPAASAWKKPEVQAALDRLRENCSCEAIYLLDVHQHLRAESTSAAFGFSHLQRQLVAAMQSITGVMLLRDRNLTLLMEAVPIGGANGRRAGGKLVLLLDSGRFLAPVLRPLSVAGRSGASFLVFQAWKQWQYFAPAQPGNEDWATEPGGPALLQLVHRAFASGAAFGVFPDQGKPQWAYLQPVEGTSWLVGSRVSHSEALSELVGRLRWKLLLFALCLVLLMALVWMRILASRHETAQEVIEQQQRMLEFRHFAQEIVQGIPFGLILVDEQGCLLSANRAAGEILDMELAVSASLQDVLADRLDASCMEHLVDPVVHQREFWGEFHTARGEQRWLKFQKLTHAGERHGSRLILMEDRSESRRSENAILLRDRAMAAASIGITIADARDPLLPTLYVNPAFERLTGYSSAEMLGRSCNLLQGPETDTGARQQIRRALDASQECRVTLLNYRKDGTEFWNELVLTPVRDRDGLVTHYVGFQSDVTERLRLEKRLQHAERLELAGRMAGGVAHDFNNLLSVIVGRTELMMLSESLDTERRSLREVHRAAQRAASLTQQLLSISRRRPGDTQDLHLDTLLMELQPRLARLAGAGIELHLDRAGELGLVRAVRSQIEDLILSLVSNARESLAPGGRIVISTGQCDPDRPCDAGFFRPSPWDQPALSGPMICLAIADDGKGMPRQILPHIFEPFFTTKSPGEGTGLGLATAYGIVMQSGGRISVRSTPGEGSKFVVHLPQVESGAMVDSVETRSGGIRTS